MPRFRVTGDVRHAFIHVIDADTEDEAIEQVEEMNAKDLDDVQTGPGGTAIEVQTSEELDE